MLSLRFWCNQDREQWTSGLRAQAQVNRSSWHLWKGSSQHSIRICSDNSSSFASSLTNIYQKINKFNQGGRFEAPLEKKKKKIFDKAWRRGKEKPGVGVKFYWSLLLIIYKIIGNCLPLCISISSLSDRCNTLITSQCYKNIRRIFRSIFCIKYLNNKMIDFRNPALRTNSLKKGEDMFLIPNHK